MSMLPEFNSSFLYRNQLIKIVKQSIPKKMNLLAANFAQYSGSSYWLLQRRGLYDRLEWLTLRISDHKLWLKNACQLELICKYPINYKELSFSINSSLKNSRKIFVYSFYLTKLDIAILKLLVFLEKNKLVWFIKLPKNISESHKKKPFDLNDDFMNSELYLGNRNNANLLLELIKLPSFQKKISSFFGYNLIFSQFTKHHLLKLLPTNQWIQPIFNKENNKINWKKELLKKYGKNFLFFCLKRTGIVKNNKFY